MKLKLLRSNGNEYDKNSYYELPDDIKEKILNFKKPDTTKISSGWPRKTMLNFQRILPNGKFLYENTDGDLITISKDIAEKTAKEDIKVELEKEFNILATKYLNEHILPQKCGYAFAMKAEKNEFKTIRFGNMYSGIGISVSESRTGHYSINTEGELVTRNIHFEHIATEEVLTFRRTIEIAVQEINSFVNIMKDNRGYYYVESKKGKFALVPYEGKSEYSVDVECGFKLIRNHRDNVYYNYGESRNKITMKVKDTVPSSNDELKQDLLDRINKFFKDKEKYENIHCRTNE